MAFAFLPTLRPRDWRATVCVRVCRKWEYRGGTDDGPIQHVDLVFVDEQGNSMYGEIPAQEVDAKSPLIEEGGIYVISRFRVSNAKSGYRPVDARYMIEFTLHTVVSPARDPVSGFPEYAYKITPIDSLAPHTGDTKNFLDTIGTLVEVSAVATVHLPNKPAPTLTRHIVLRDLSYSEIKITLWGQRATAFTTDGIYNSDEATPVVVLFVGGLMKSYQGNHYLSANTASRWYFNPSIPEARPFYASFHNQRLEIRSVPAPIEQKGRIHVPTQLEEKTLKQLNDMDPYEFADGGYRCTVTIGRLVPNVSWWFPSCTKCSKSCVPDGTGYQCNACSNTSFKFKYKLCFMAQDSTDEAEMVCFGDVARRIVGKPVQQLLKTSTNSNAYPPDIARLVSLRFTFAVTLTQQSYYRAQKTYNVASLVTSYGQQLAIQHVAANRDANRQDVVQPTGSPSENTDGPFSPQLPCTPPPALDITETPAVKKQRKSDRPRDDQHPVARRNLFGDGPRVDQKKQHPSKAPDSTGVQPTGKDTADDKSLSPEEEPSSVARESG